MCLLKVQKVIVFVKTCLDDCKVLDLERDKL